MMRSSLKILFCLAAWVPFLKGNPLEPKNGSNLCGSWIKYKNDKCLNIMDTVGLKTQEEAEDACRSLRRPSSFSGLVTVKNREQQDFLHQLIYANKMTESVWLGLKVNNGSRQFQWNDGSDLEFSNLMKSNMSGHHNKCVEMNEAGLWMAVSCTKKNMAVCEGEPMKPMATLQNDQLNADATEIQQKSEKDCEEKILITQKKVNLLKEATDNTMHLLKEAREKMADLEQSDEPNPADADQQHKGQDVSPASFIQPNMCGDWTAYKDEKCFKVAAKAGFQTKDAAEVVCQNFARELNLDSVPNLITIKSKDEQVFLQRFLFVERQIVDNVWLGLSRKDVNASFEWDDGSEMSFSNWDKRALPNVQHDCVQMESGDGAAAAGLWLNVNCKRKYAVVCERRPAWSLAVLQNALLDFRLEKMKQKEREKKFEKSQLSIIEMKEKINSLDQQVATLTTKTSVPVGFIYVQLPDQLPPLLLWPATNWTDVSDHYAGLFFRVAGGKAAPFGQVQEASTSRLEEVDYIANKSHGSAVIPADGSWSGLVETGGQVGHDNHALNFRLSTSEIRPRNQAFKIWKRVQSGPFPVVGSQRVTDR